MIEFREKLLRDLLSASPYYSVSPQADWSRILHRSATQGNQSFHAPPSAMHVSFTLRSETPAGKTTWQERCIGGRVLDGRFGGEVWSTLGEGSSCAPFSCKRGSVEESGLTTQPAASSLGIQVHCVSPVCTDAHQTSTGMSTAQRTDKVATANCTLPPRPSEPNFCPA